MSVNPLKQEAPPESAAGGKEGVLGLSSEPPPIETVPLWKQWIQLPRRHPLVSVLVLVLVAGAVYWVNRGGDTAQDKPLLATVEMGNIENTVTAAGSLQPSNYVDVGAQVSGQLQELFVEVGDVVEQGQLLAQIDATVQAQRVEASKANLRAQEAQLASREAALKLARANAQRQEMLMAEQATSQQEYDNAINALASAEASLIQLKAQIEQSSASLKTEEAELGYTKIYAPIAGTVVSIAVKEGQTLNATQQAPTVLRVADLTTMTVETEVSEADVGKLKKGMEVYFTTLGSGERRWYGSLRQILPTPTTSNNVVLYTAMFDVGNPDGTLLPSMTAQVFFVTSAARNVLTVPMGAVKFAETTGPRPSGPGADAMASGGPQTAPPNFPNGSFAPPGAGGPGGGFDPSQITPEMRERFRAARERMGNGGGFDPSQITPEMRERFQARMGGGVPPMPVGAQRPRQATVKVVQANGTTKEQEITVGVTSRVLAEVISGLKEGDQVVAGIIQAQSQNTNNNNNNFRGRPPFMRF